MNFREIFGTFPLKRLHSVVCLAIGCGTAIGLLLSLVACGPAKETVTSTSSANNANSQEELAAVFDASKETLFEAKTSADLVKCRALQYCEIVAVADGIKVVAQGDDAAMLLPPFAEGKRFIVQVIIDSPVDSAIQLFHKLRGQKEYGETKGALWPLTKGMNTIYFKVEDGNVIDPLRLDPSFKPGEYTIKSIMARAIPAPATS